VLLDVYFYILMLDVVSINFRHWGVIAQFNSGG